MERDCETIPEGLLPLIVVLLDNLFAIKVTYQACYCTQLENKNIILFMCFSSK